MNTTQQQKIQHIASQSGSRRDFLERFIDHAIEEYDAIGGMFWDCTAAEPKPICQHYRGGEEMLKLGCSSQQHNEFLRQACNSPEPLLVSADGKDESQANSEQSYPSILLVPARHGERIEVAELFFEGSQPREEIAGKIGPLSSLCRGASIHGMPPARAAAESGTLGIHINASDIEAYIHSLHQTLDLKDSSRTIANETRRFLDCDRVSVVQMQGSRCRTLAVSGQPSVNRRSNAIRMLEKVANRVLPTRQMFWYPDNDALLPQIDVVLQEYLENSATRTMVIVPVFDKVESDQLQVDAHREPKKLIGGIIVEHCREQWDRAQQALKVELATRHGSDAFRNSFQHQSLFLYSVWKWIGKSKMVLAARHLPKTIAACIGVLAVVFALIFVPSDFELSCSGTLVPQDRVLVFPRSPGIVSEVLVEHGQDVDSGEPIVRLTDLDLEDQLTEIEGQISEVEQTIRAIESSRLGNRADDEASQKENLKLQQIELESLKEQQRIYLKRQKNLLVTSPLDGRVMTWDVQKRLKNRPVEVSNSLMELADVDGQWLLELDLPDRKVGHFMKRWNDARENNQPVEVEFILAAEPGITHVGEVKAVGTSTEVNAENEHHLKILVDIDIEDIDIRQSHSGVFAKIDCGKTSLGYAWFHPLKEFVQAKVLFPLW